jgi:hypothetical protein
MQKVLLLIALALPPWVAAKLGAPKWGMLLAALPFFLLAMNMNSGGNDPEQYMFGRASGAVGRWGC